MSLRCPTRAGAALCFALALVDSPARAQALSWSDGAYAHPRQVRVAAVVDEARGRIHLIVDAEVDTDSDQVALLVPARRVFSWGSVSVGTFERLSGLVGADTPQDATPARAHFDMGASELLPADEDSRRSWFASRRLAFTRELATWLLRRDDAGEAVIAYTFGPSAPKQADQKKGVRRQVSLAPVRASYAGPMDGLLHARPSEHVTARARYLLRHRVSEPERRGFLTHTTAVLLTGLPRLLEGTDNPRSGVVRGARAQVTPKALADAVVETAGWSFDPAETPLWHAASFSWDDARLPPLTDIPVLAEGAPRERVAAVTPTSPRVVKMPLAPARPASRVRRPWKPPIALCAGGLALAIALVTLILEGRHQARPRDWRKPT